LSRSWDITTASFLGVFSVASQDTVPQGITFKPDLSKFYIVGATNDAVFQYSTGNSNIDLTAKTIDINGTTNVIGPINFQDPAVFAVNNTERMRIDSSGNLLVGITSARANAGDVQVSKGISFPATQSAQSDANTLDDYEEGTWTPVIGGDGGESGQSYSRQVGTYTKVGNLVCATFSVVLSAKGTITGFAVIKGLPFASNSTANAVSGSSIGYFASLAVNSTWVGFQLSTNATIFYLETTTAAQATVTDMTTTNIGNTTRFDGTIVYRTA